MFSPLLETESRNIIIYNVLNIKRTMTYSANAILGWHIYQEESEFKIIRIFITIFTLSIRSQQKQNAYNTGSLNTKQGKIVFAVTNNCTICSDKNTLHIIHFTLNRKYNQNLICYRYIQHQKRALIFRKGPTNMRINLRKRCLTRAFKIRGKRKL